MNGEKNDTGKEKRGLLQPTRKLNERRVRERKELQEKDTEEERREGGKEADDWNREGESVTII